MAMWAETDFPPSGQPTLDSYAEPQCGRTYTMYHGTSRQAIASIQMSGLRPSNDGMLGRGVYVSRDWKKASRYPLRLPEIERVVLKVVVSVGQVKKIDYQGHPLQKTWRQHGYDTAWVPPNCGMVPSGLEEDCVWDPNRITIVEIVWGPLVIGCPSALELARFGRYPTLRSNEEPQWGQSYTMYHGTSREAAASIQRSGFRPSYDGILGRGVYVSRDAKKASGYPRHLPERERVVLEVFVSVGRVMKIYYQGHPLQKTWRQHGYDMAWVPPNCGMVPSGLEEDCVWDPNRIQICSFFL